MIVSTFLLRCVCCRTRCGSYLQLLPQDGRPLVRTCSSNTLIRGFPCSNNNPLCYVGFRQSTSATSPPIATSSRIRPQCSSTIAYWYGTRYLSFSCFLLFYSTFASVNIRSLIIYHDASLGYHDVLVSYWPLVRRTPS